jgi:hypothetical protein
LEADFQAIPKTILIYLMQDDSENPFSVTKATEFTDSQINEYWVNFNTETNTSIKSMLNPNEFLPKYVVGGKGCGKTHILRYFSFPLQKIRWGNDLTSIINNDKYIGLYSVLHGLNSSRFEGKGIPEDQWQAIFEYYFELYISETLMSTVQEFMIQMNIQGALESKIIEMVVKQFSNYEDIKGISTIEEFKEYLRKLRRKIDGEVLNAAFKRKLEYDEVKLSFSTGDIIFGFPAVISNTIAQFKGVKFIFIFDEFEKLFEWQKRYINSLVWDKKTPVTFWIGARRYGYTTRQTKTGEEMKRGSEYQEVDLDFIIRNNEGLYRDFAKELYVRRLEKYYRSKGAQMDPQVIHDRFRDSLEKYNEDALIATIADKGKKREFKHVKELRKKLQSLTKSKSIEFSGDEEIDAVIKPLLADTNNDPLEQKYKFFLFYKMWYQAKNNSSFEKIVQHINAEYTKDRQGLASEFAEIRDKRKKDFIAQLIKENNIKNPEYCGFEKFVDLSQGNARTFILILKKIVEYGKIRGEKPMEDDSKISLDTQYLAIYDAARWFYEDAELVGDTGRQMYYSLKYLADYLMLFRFCDKPTETTVSSFYIKAGELSSGAIECLETMDVHSILVESTGRFEKNSGRKEQTFVINRILAPLWNLPIVVRGTVHLNKETADAIFDPLHHSKFDKLYKERKNSLNAPEFLKINPSMFGN